MSTTPFNDTFLRDWFFTSFTNSFLQNDIISTMGTGPFAAYDFDQFLHRKHLIPHEVLPNTNILVIGTENWDTNKLTSLLVMRYDKSLKIYSQEMFLMYLANNLDPYDNLDVMTLLSKDHPVFIFIAKMNIKWSENSFTWPSTVAYRGNGSLSIYAPANGLLSHLGYKVGKSGLSIIGRRRILDQVFSSELPLVVSADYMQQWDRPESKERLKKLADSIAAFCRNIKRRYADNGEAINDWEQDLEYLHQKYYLSRFSFQWPLTE